MTTGKILNLLIIIGGHIDRFKHIGDAAIEIGGDAGVERAVPAPYDVDPPPAHAAAPPLLMGVTGPLFTRWRAVRVGK